MTPETMNSKPSANGSTGDATVVRRHARQDGKRISYLAAECTRAGNNPAILLLHGTGVSARSWTLQLQTLGHALQVLAIDLPGHGESDPIDKATLEGYADAAYSLLDALGTGPVFVAGHSLGGAVAQVLGARHPEVVRGLALLSTCVKLPETDGCLQRLYRCLPEPIRKVLFLWMANKILFAPSASRQAVCLGMEEILTCRPETTLKDVAAAQAMDLQELAQNLRVPTLILCGDRDKVTPMALSDRLNELIPGSRLRIVKGAGHMLPLEAPGQVNQELLDFVNFVAPGEIHAVPSIGGIRKRRILRRLIDKVIALFRRT
jgi:pimeloyl-ACP methyl ester carboxylesterase